MADRRTAVKADAKKVAVKATATRKALATPSTAKKAAPTPSTVTAAKKTAPAPATTKQTASAKAPVAKNPARKKDSDAPSATPSANSPERKHQRRADLGASADPFFERQVPELRRFFEVLRALIKKAAPDARESMKWGMPYYELKSGFCALYAADTYVGLNLMAPPEAFDDPQGKLEGKGKTMRHLKVRTSADLDEASILSWVKTAVAHHS